MLFSHPAFATASRPQNGGWKQGPAVSPQSDEMPTRAEALEPPETWKMSDIFTGYGPRDTPDLILIPTHSSVDVYDDDVNNGVIISRVTAPGLTQTLKKIDEIRLIWPISLRRS